MEDIDQMAALLQMLIKDKLIVHVTVKRPPEQYGSIEIDTWHTIYVDPGMSLDDRIKLQAEATRQAMLVAEEEVELSLRRHRQLRIDAAVDEAREAEAKKEAAMQRAAATKAQNEANKAAQIAARDAAQTVAAVIPSPRPVAKPIPKPAPSIVPGKKIITSSNPTDSDSEHHDMES